MVALGGVLFLMSESPLYKGGVAPTRDGRLPSFVEGQGVVFRWAPLQN